MSKTSFSKLIDSDIPVLIDFHALWCGPCKMLSPIIKELKNDYGNKLRIIKIDVDKNPELAKKLDVMSMPTLMIFKNGELKWRTMGVQTKIALSKQIDKILQEEPSVSDS
jgi:thioredoxin 1